MRTRLFTLIVMLSLCTVTVAAELPAGTTLQLRQLDERATRLTADKAGSLAKDYLSAAQASITAARSAIATENEKGALQNLEAANLQLNLAEMKVVEKELTDETTARKEELKKLEAQLERHLQGEE